MGNRGIGTEKKERGTGERVQGTEKGGRETGEQRTGDTGKEDGEKRMVKRG